MCWTLPLGSRIAPDTKVLLQITKNYGSLSFNFFYVTLVNVHVEHFEQYLPKTKPKGNAEKG